MIVSSLLTPELVLPSLAAETKADVLVALAALVARARPDVDALRLADALQEREREATTALENGIAIPHVRLAGLAGPVVALARTRAAIACDAVDGKPTRLFLMLAVPGERPSHLPRLLADAARLLSDRRCRRRLLEAESADELITAVREHDERGLRAA